MDAKIQEYGKGNSAPPLGTPKNKGLVEVKKERNDLINKRMHPDPSKRPTAAEALQHPYVKPESQKISNEEAQKVLSQVLDQRSKTSKH